MLTTRDSWLTPSWHLICSPGSHASLTTTPLRVPPGTSPPISPRRGFRPVPLLPKDIILSSFLRCTPVLGGSLEEKGNSKCFLSQKLMMYITVQPRPGDVPWKRHLSDFLPLSLVGPFQSGCPESKVQPCTPGRAHLVTLLATTRQCYLLLPRPGMSTFPCWASLSLPLTPRSIRPCRAATPDRQGQVGTLDHPWATAPVSHRSACPLGQQYFLTCLCPQVQPCGHNQASVNL